MESRFLHDLNDSQRRAVLATEGAVLVLAGAGTGKTKTITHRIAHLITDKGVDPASILAVTFTNKAADEMRERVIGLVGKETGSKPHISTFHSLGLRILRDHGVMLGYRPGFSIYGDSDQAGVVREVVRDLMPGRNIDLWRVLGVISRAKNDVVTPERFSPLSFNEHELHAAAIYPRYQQRLKGCNAVDFDDIIMLPLLLMEAHLEIQRSLMTRFRYIMVDEYQDTNQAQYRLVSMLAGDGGNLCVVGDDDQSIYGWRGADAGRILAFETEHPGCTVITLDRNYRSTRTILDAANGIIGNNRIRKRKRLWTDSGGDSRIRLVVAADEEEEAERIVDRILAEVGRGAAYGDCAILYRTNAQSRPFEEVLRLHGVPYRVVGGQQFYERKEVKDSLAYLRVMVNPMDEQSLLRIINFPKRGIGDATLISVNRWALERHLPLFVAYGRAGEIVDIPETIRGKLLSFHRMIEEERKMLLSPGGPLAPRLHSLFERLKLYEEMERLEPDRVKARRRKENIDQIVSSLAHYESTDTAPSLVGFLDRISLFDEDREKDRERRRGEGDDAVTLMSLHASKGLEFPIVFLVGMEEDLLPHRNSISDDSTIEEERRLCYVGITRARRTLVLSRARRRKRMGRWEEREESRFLAEIPPDLLVIEGTEGSATSEEERRRVAEQTFHRLRSILGG